MKQDQFSFPPKFVSNFESVHVNAVILFMMLTSDHDQPGGQGELLAVELDPGKTVYVLAFILDHQRTGLPCPEYLEPVVSDDDNFLSYGRSSPKKKLKIKNLYWHL